MTTILMPIALALWFMGGIALCDGLYLLDKELLKGLYLSIIGAALMYASWTMLHNLFIAGHPWLK